MGNKPRIPALGRLWTLNGSVGCAAITQVHISSSAQQPAAPFKANFSPFRRRWRELAVIGLDLPNRMVDANTVIAKAVIALCEQQLNICLSSSDVKVVKWSPKQGQTRFVACVSFPSKVAAMIFGRKGKLLEGLSIGAWEDSPTLQTGWMKRRGLVEVSEAPLPVVTPPPPPPPRPPKGRPSAKDSFRTPSKSLPRPTRKSPATEGVEDVLSDGSPGAKSIVRITRKGGKKIFYCTFESTGKLVFPCDKVSTDLLESFEKKQQAKKQSKQPKKRGRPAGSLRPAATVPPNQVSLEVPSSRVESPNDPPVFGAGEGVSGTQGQVLQGGRRSQRLQNQAREQDSRA